jgi:hypothetical protein
MEEQALLLARAETAPERRSQTSCIMDYRSVINYRVLGLSTVNAEDTSSMSMKNLEAMSVDDLWSLHEEIRP